MDTFSQDAGDKVCQAIKIGDIDTVRSVVQNAISKSRTEGLVGWSSYPGAPEYGHSLLHLATDSALLDANSHASPDPDIVAQLLAVGISANSRSSFAHHRDTPLHGISRKATASSPQIIRQLIAAGADVNAQNDQGDTPLHEAAEWGATELVEVLLQEGARKDVKNLRNRLSTDLANGLGYAGLAQMIADAPVVAKETVVEPQQPPVLDKSVDAGMLKSTQGFFSFFGSRETSEPKRTNVSVYNMIYADGGLENLPTDDSGQQHFPEGCKHWFHLPANNKQWVLHLMERICAISGLGKLYCDALKDMVDETFHGSEKSTSRCRIPGVYEASRNLASTSQDVTLRAIVFPFIDVDAIQEQNPHTIVAKSQQKMAPVFATSGPQNHMWKVLREYGNSMYPARTLNQVRFETLGSQRVKAKDKQQLFGRVNGDPNPDNTDEMFRREAPILTVPQVWMWQIGNGTTITALQDRWSRDEIGTTNLFAGVTPARVLGEVAVESLLRNTIDQAITFVDRVIPTQKNAFSCTDAFSWFVSDLTDRTASCFDDFVEQIERSTRPSLGPAQTEAAIIRDISQLQAEAKIIISVQQEQVEVAKELFGEIEHVPLDNFHIVLEVAAKTRKSIQELLELRRNEQGIHTFLAIERLWDRFVPFAVLMVIEGALVIALSLLALKLMEGVEGTAKIAWTLIISAIAALAFVMIVDAVVQAWRCLRHFVSTAGDRLSPRMLIQSVKEGRRGSGPDLTLEKETSYDV